MERLIWEGWVARYADIYCEAIPCFSWPYCTLVRLWVTSDLCHRFLQFLFRLFCPTLCKKARWSTISTLQATWSWFPLIPCFYDAQNRRLFVIFGSHWTEEPPHRSIAAATGSLRGWHSFDRVKIASKMSSTTLPQGHFREFVVIKSRQICYHRLKTKFGTKEKIRRSASNTFTKTLSERLHKKN